MNAGNMSYTTSINGGMESCKEIGAGGANEACGECARESFDDVNAYGSHFLYSWSALSFKSWIIYHFFLICDILVL